MAATLRSARRGRRAIAKLRFQESVFDDLTSLKGALTDIQRAAMCDIDRTTLSRIKSNKITPNLDLAMHMAETAGVPVERLWIRQAA